MIEKKCFGITNEFLRCEKCGLVNECVVEIKVRSLGVQPTRITAEGIR